jgi:hypothetical protein
MMRSLAMPGLDPGILRPPGRARSSPAMMDNPR